MALSRCRLRGGDVTTRLAELAHPATVVGIDIDVAQLEIARQEAAASGRTNVEFRAVDAETCDEEVDERFDLVYARFLLTHLPDPTSALAAMVRLARAGGVVAVEDIDVAAHFCYPPSAAFDRFVEWYTAAHRARGGDPMIGLRLPRMLLDEGIHDVAMNVVQPAGLYGDITQIAPLRSPTRASPSSISGSPPMTRSTRRWPNWRPSPVRTPWSACPESCRRGA